MADFSLCRRARIEADPARIHALVDDFRGWHRWSPWEGSDPDLRRSYGGTDRGVGSTYHWSGNKKAGEGEMRIIESTPSGVAVDLTFLKPFKATNVTWTMTGTRSATMGVIGALIFDKAIGRDFDRGLAAMRREAERGWLGPARLFCCH